MLLALALAAALVPHDPSTGWDTDVFHAYPAPPRGAAGEAVALGDAVAVVGAPRSGAGCVFVHRRPSPSAGWHLEAVLHPSDGLLDQRFGASVAVVDDELVVVGSPRATDGQGERGAVYVYRLTGPAQWTEVVRFTGSGTSPGDRFGASVAAVDASTASVDRLRLLVGAPRHAAAGVPGAGGAYAFLWDVGSGVTTQLVLPPPDPTPDKHFGAAVALDPGQDRGAVGAPGDDQGAGPDGGAVYIYDVSTPTWLLQAKRWASDAAPGARFGATVAAASGRVVVGAPRHDAGGADAGSLYVLDATTPGWVETARLDGAQAGGRLGAALGLAFDGAVGAWRLVAGAPGTSTAYAGSNAGGPGWAPLVAQGSPDGTTADGFAAAVAVTVAGALVGAPRDDGRGPDAGLAYAFDAPGPPWTHAYLNPSSHGPHEAFGSSVAVDADLAAVGAPGEDDVGEDSGAAYVWKRVGSVWEPQAKLTADDRAVAYAGFGVELDVDGESLAVGAPFESQAVPGAGSVFVFRRAGSDWVREAELASGVPADGFGEALALDGDRLAVGADQAGAGAVFTFERAGSAWTAGPVLAAPDGAGGDQFGHDVALDGDVLAVGAFRHAHTGLADAGAVYVFERSGGNWTFVQEVLSQAPVAFERFGVAVDLDGPWLVVGASGNDANGQDAGAAYVFRRGPAGWSFQSLVLPFLGTAGARFGSSLAVDRGTLVVGAPLDDTAYPAAGAAYLYSWDGYLWPHLATLPPLSANPIGLRGTSVALSGNGVLVGEPGAIVAFPAAGSVEVFELVDRPRLYCTGKTSSLGCVPFTSYAGHASASDTQPFRVTGNAVAPNEPGFLLYGFAKGNLDFHGGKLCVKLPFRRLFPIQIAQPFGPPPCTGTLERNFNKRIQSGADPLLTPGQRVFAQWRARDPADPAGFGDALTDALRFTICP